MNELEVVRASSRASSMEMRRFYFNNHACLNWCVWVAIAFWLTGDERVSLPHPTEDPDVVSLFIASESRSKQKFDPNPRRFWLK